MEGCGGARPSKIAIVSPHRDDAAFSCGLLIASLLRSGHEVTIVNLFTRSDYSVNEIGIEPLSDRTEAVSLARFREDLCASDEIRDFASVSSAQKCRLSLHDLGWLDAPLRLTIPRESVVLAPLSVNQVATQVRDFAARLPDLQCFDHIFAPLALGDHIDHRIARDAVKRTVPPSQLAFYEDLPYAARLSDERRTFEATTAYGDVGFCAVVRSSICVADGLQAKARVALCYASQIGPEVAEEMARYGAALTATSDAAVERWYGEREAAEKLRAALRGTAEVAIDS